MFLIVCIRFLCLNSGLKDLFPKSFMVSEFCIHMLYFEVIFNEVYMKVFWGSMDIQ